MSADGAIADAIVAAVQGLSLEIADGKDLPAASVVRRKTPSLPTGVQPPQVVVVVGNTPARVERLTASQKLSYWPASVVVVTAGGRKHEDDERARAWREEIEQVVFDQQDATFGGISGFNQADATGKSPFDPTAMDKDLVHLTINVEVQIIEELQ